MKALMVAEKPSIAKSVAQILANGRANSVCIFASFCNGRIHKLTSKHDIQTTSKQRRQKRPGKNKYCRNFDFRYAINGSQYDVTMTSVMGHLMSSDFPPEYKKWSRCHPIQCFDLPIIKFVSKDMESVCRNLEVEGRNAQVLVIWTDCDREGENIGSEIVSVVRAKNPRIQVLRARFSVIQGREIHQAMSNLVYLDERQSEAVEARMELDLRIGAAFTRFQTMRLGYRFSELKDNIISYGGCQFPTLGFVVDQYFRAERFVEEPFWRIDMKHTKDGMTVKFNWDRDRLFCQAACQAIYDVCVQRRVATVTRVTSKPTSKWKPLPLTTVEMQKCGARLLRISSDRMMQIAEKLYNDGIISYPRTETDQFDANFQLKPIIERLGSDGTFSEYCNQLLNGGKFVFPRNGHNNDKAHPPIHPVRAAQNLTGDEKRVYEFVVRRFLACCSDNAKGQETVLEVELAGEKFTAKGLMITERNYLDIYVYDKWNASQLPVFQQNEIFVPSELRLNTGSTSPPSLLTEADLINLMDKNGIGTDATIQDHIKKILERQYAFKEKPGNSAQEVFYPSTLGMALVEGYDSLDFDYSLSKPHLRAFMEKDMKLICDGVRTRQDVVAESVNMYREVYRRAEELVDVIEASLARYLGHEPDQQPPAAATAAFEPTRPVMPCPKCGSTLTLKSLPSGVNVVGCDRYPQCKESIFLSETIVASVDVSQQSCQRCTIQPDRPTMQLQFVFHRGKVPPTIPENLTSCIRCDDELRELFRSAPRPPATQTNPRSGGNNTNHGKTVSANQYPPNSNYNTYSTTGMNTYNPTPQPTQTQPFRPSTTSYSQQQTGNADRSCNCNEPAVLLTVSKEGPNQGRQFYKCSNREGGCNYFSWADEEPRPRGNGGYGGYGGGSNTFGGNGGGSGSSSTMSGMDLFRVAANAAYENGSNDKPTCECGLVATQRTVSKDGPNKGRSFWSCTKSSYRCKFFVWDDERGGSGCGNDGTRPGSGGKNGGFGSSSFGGSSSAAASATCYKCGEVGHFANTCSSAGGSTRGRGKRTRGGASGTRKRKRGGKNDDD